MRHRLRLRSDHAAIAELLPDYVLGKLDEGSLRRVGRHLAHCPRCRGECDETLEVLGALAAVSPPSPAVRDAIVRRAAAEGGAAGALGLGRPPLRLLRVTPTAPKRAAAAPVPPAVARPCPAMPFGQPLPRWALAVASAAVLVVGLFASWNFESRSESAQQMRIYALTSDPSAAHPLIDSDLTAPASGVPASGVLYAEPTSSDAYLIANGLPALPPTEQYQVWLFTGDGQPIGAGTLSVGSDGAARTFLKTPAPFDDYFAVALSAEPKTGAAAPTSELTLGGVLQP